MVDNSGSLLKIIIVPLNLCTVWMHVQKVKIYDPYLAKPVLGATSK